MLVGFYRGDFKAGLDALTLFNTNEEDIIVHIEVRRINSKVVLDRSCNIKKEDINSQL